MPAAIIGFSALALAACVAPRPPAGAEPRRADSATPIACAPIAVMDRTLRQRHAEEPIWRGIGVHGRLVVLYQGPHGTWTMVAVAPYGRACIAGAGGGGELLRTGRDGGKAT